MLDAISTRLERVNGVVLEVAADGPEQGPLVILLHGFPDAWWGWKHQLSVLAGNGFRVVAPNQRGYGRSDKPRPVWAYDLDRLADDVIELAACTSAGPAAVSCGRA
jgi:epoxide hydrolase 4